MEEGDMTGGGGRAVSVNGNFPIRIFTPSPPTPDAQRRSMSRTDP